MKLTSYILIDDDIHSNKLCKLYFRRALPHLKIIDFTSPEDGLTYIEDRFNHENSESAILLLDVNMPTMTGWEFLMKYDGLDQLVKDQIFVYVISSSVDTRDKHKADSNKYVKEFLQKPLEISVIKRIYENNS